MEKVQSPPKKNVTSKQKNNIDPNYLYKRGLKRQECSQQHKEKLEKQYESQLHDMANSKKMTPESERYYVQKITKELIKVWQDLEILDDQVAASETMNLSMIK